MSKPTQSAAPLSEREAIEKEVLREFSLDVENGEYYQDSPVFDRHLQFNLMVKALIDARAALSRQRESRELGTCETDDAGKAMPHVKRSDCIDWRPMPRPEPAPTTCVFSEAKHYGGKCDHTGSSAVNLGVAGEAAPPKPICICEPHDANGVGGSWDRECPVHGDYEPEGDYVGIGRNGPTPLKPAAASEGPSAAILRTICDRLFFHIQQNGGKGNPFERLSMKWFTDLAVPKLREELAQPPAGAGSGEALKFYNEHYRDFDDGHLDLEDMLEFAEAYSADLQAKLDAANRELDAERSGSNCDKLDRARKTRRLWQQRAEALAAENQRLRQVEKELEAIKATQFIDWAEVNRWLASDGGKGKKA